MSKQLLVAVAAAFALAACGKQEAPKPAAPATPPAAEKKDEPKKEEAKAPEAPKAEEKKDEPKKEEAKK